MRLGTGKVERGRAEDEWTGSCPGLGVRRSRMNPPHTCPGSHLSLWAVPGGVGSHRRRGRGEGLGIAGSGTLRTPGSTVPRGRRPGRRRVQMWGAGGEALPRAASRPFQGEVLLWGAQSLSPPGPSGAPRAQGAQPLPGPHSVQGSESQLPSPHPAPPLPSAPGPITDPFPKPTAQGCRARPGTPYRFRGSSPAHRRFAARFGGVPVTCPPPLGPPPLACRPRRYGYGASRGG